MHVSPGARLLVAVAAVLLFLPSLVLADTFAYASLDSVIRGEYEYRFTEDHQALVRAYWPATEAMTEAYDLVYGAFYESLIRERTRLVHPGGDSTVTDSGELRMEIGLVFAAGQAIQWDDDWDVEKADLFLLAIPFSATPVLKLGGLYLGLGIGGFWGAERIEGKISRTSLAYTDEFEWHDTSFRWSFEGHALLGTVIELSKSMSMVLETQWTQAGDGRLKRAELTEEDIAEGWGEVWNDFQHSNFNFTGLAFSLGLRW
jgi:hypothetical protein